AFNTKDPFSIEYRLRRYDGEYRWIIDYGRPYSDLDGNFAGYMGSCYDITDLKRAEQAYALEKERLAMTLRSIGEGVITTDMEGKILLFNKAAGIITGWASEGIKGKSVNEAFHLFSKEFGEPCENPVETVLKTGNNFGPATCVLFIPENETKRFVSVACSPVRDTESRIIGAVLVLRDITEHKKLEEETLKSVKLESLGILAGGIAHDFNNILMGAILNIYLAKMRSNPQDEIFKILTEAEEALMQAKNLTQQLLTFSKGGAPILKTATIGELVKNSARFVLRGSSVSCEFFVPEDLWPVEIDEGQISQVINNLVINAAQAMPEGGIIKIHAENIARGEVNFLPVKPGNFVKITIKDHGTGIPEEHLKKIFDPYFTTKQKGSGLGLSTSYSIIKNHGGYIAVESEMGAGSTFYIYLPVTKKTIQVKNDVKEISPFAGRGRILIMDDEEDIRKTAGQILTGFGYEVEYAGDGTEAIELYRIARDAGQSFDVVIMDLTIPGGMGGREAIQKLMEIDPGVKAIVSSGYSSDPVMANHKEYGFSGVIAKPYHIEELNRLLIGLITGNPKSELV
ncbi:MAG: PAS domain S-box protein, partial [Firmicutes bacterium]|nr:PAS domain S-box protein [Bacillota bacterium]